MKYVILIHSNPQPWGHPTSDHTAEYAALPQAEKDRLGAHWDEVHADARARGEIVYASPLGDPSEARVFRYQDRPVITDGPYAETSEHLAGFFVIDVPGAERAEEIAESFSCPGDTIELRPLA